MKIFNLLNSENKDTQSTSQDILSIKDDLSLIKSAFVNQLTFNKALSEELVKLRMQLAETECALSKNELSKHEQRSWGIRRLYQSYPKSVVWGMYSSEEHGFGEIFLDFPGLYLGIDSSLSVDSDTLIAANNIGDNNDYVLKKGVKVAAYIFEKKLIETYGESDYLYMHTAQITSVTKKDDWYEDIYKVTLHIDLSDTLRHMRFPPPPKENVIVRIIDIRDVNSFPCIVDDENSVEMV